MPTLIMVEDSENIKNKVKQEQIHDLLFSKELGWQEIIYDLINSEQLDPWDIDISILTERYLKKIQELEEADFFVSSKVLLAASLLLRIKAEILLNRYITNIDDILFGKKEIKKSILERIELNEDIPELVPRSPLPRLRKVTLNELMESLNKAITTENRRIKRDIIDKNALRMATYYSLPRRKYNIRDKIKEIYDKLFSHFEEDKLNKKIAYSDFVKGDREEKIISFLPLLHLEQQKKVWLDQEKHFEEIYIWLHEVYYQNNPDPFADLKQELEEMKQEGEIEEKIEEELNEEEEEEIKTKSNKEHKKRLKKLDKEFENPLGEMLEK